MSKVCTVPTCENKAVGRGLCHKHYKKWQRYGDPLVGIEYQRRHGDGTVTYAGYVAVMVNGKKKQQHVLVAEHALGKSLPIGAIVHHVNKDTKDNRNQNLVICQDQQYHKILHRRQDALEACGNANWRKCCICKQYDDPSNMSINGSPLHGERAYHKSCNTNRERERVAKNAK